MDVAIRIHPVGRPRRLPLFDYTGFWRYSVTTCTYRRQRLFQEPGVICRTLDQFLQAGAAEDCSILAYCFMPDHVHLLVAGATLSAQFPRFMKLAKQRSGWAYRRLGRGRLWQEGYVERVLRSDEASFDVLQYIVANPVRAGLAGSPAEYPHWGSPVHTREEILATIECGRRT